ncbi:MAG: GNAT family N-acetyltransferase [Pyrinomonadaceae bacterium]|nr:GNAT family N-acetyltransferase [Pyrinomonadaceae bacterium]
MIKFVEIEGKSNDQIWEKIKGFYQTIFPANDLVKFTQRINSAEKLFTVLAFFKDEIVGFKLGYQIDEARFYSWLGGVNPEFRKQGIANELMNRQHLWCRKNGFQIIQTKTKNSFKPMLILNIKHGFDIIELQRNESNEIKIVLEKNI